MTFDDLGLIPPLLASLKELNYLQPTPIQEAAIPIILKGRDILGSAQTGTGKTAGFALPILQQLAPFGSQSASPAKHPIRALVLLPTRELAVQVYESFQQYSTHLPLRVGCVYGGVDMAAQVAMLQKGVEILVATPGRFLDHYDQKHLFLNQLTHFVLDEADRMLDMGFSPDINRIISLLPKKRQTLLFSATFSKEIRKLADNLLTEPEIIEVAQANTVADTITHQVFLVEEAQKPAFLTEWLNENAITQALIFVDTKNGCERLCQYLQRAQISAAAIHGDKDQQERLKALNAFKQGEIKLLVATDVAARGLDIQNMPQVINYSLSHTPEDYIHRIGRTGRCGNSGSAISLVCVDEEKRLAEIEKLIGRRIKQTKIKKPSSVSPSNAMAKTSANQKRKKLPPKQNRGHSSLDFDVNKPFCCTTTEFPASRQQKTKQQNESSKSISALLGGKK